MEAKLWFNVMGILPMIRLYVIQVLCLYARYDIIEFVNGSIDPQT